MEELPPPTSAEVSTWSHDFTALSDDCGATGSATVTFTATDDCNASTTSAIFTIEDTTAPDILMEGEVLRDGGEAQAFADWLADFGEHDVRVARWNGAERDAGFRMVRQQRDRDGDLHGHGRLRKRDDPRGHLHGD